MDSQEIKDLQLSYGDEITLYSWEWLSNHCTKEMDFYKENGNLVCPNGYRLFEREKEMYGKTYKVKSISESELYPDHITINCMGKGEVSPYEVELVIKKTEQ